MEEDRKDMVTLGKSFLKPSLRIMEPLTLYVDAINTIIDNLKACGKRVNKDD